MPNQTKVHLPRDVAEAISNLQQRRANYEIVRSVFGGYAGDDPNENKIFRWARVNDERFTELLSALVNGYEVEKSPEDKVREYYDDIRALSEKYEEPYDKGTVDGIKFTLDALGITIEGINDKEESE